MNFSSPLPAVRHSDAPPIAWGGRAKRYEHHPGAVVRAYDPYRLHVLAFRNIGEMRAWHRVNFDQSTRTITGKWTRVQATVDGQLLKAEATFVSVCRDGEKRYHLVCVPGTQRATLRALRAIAGCHRRTSVVEHDPAVLAADSAHNERLELLRQAAQIHLKDGPSTDPLILAAVRDSATTRTALRRALGNLPAQLIDARASHLHCAGYLVMDLSCEDYAVELAGGAQ